MKNRHSIKHGMKNRSETHWSIHKERKNEKTEKIVDAYDHFICNEFIVSAKNTG